MNKDPSITSLVVSLPLARQGWTIVRPDPWEADLFAIGIGREDEPRQLVYICTFELPPGRYYYECEVPSGPDAAEYAVVDTGEAVPFHTLLEAMQRHLSVQRGHSS